MSWSTSELRVRLAPLNRFKPSSKIFYWPFQGGTSFVDLLCFCSVLCLLCFVRVCLYVLCGHLLGKGWPLGSRLWCLLWVCHFPIGILGQVWYLIVSIPDLCTITYFYWYRSWDFDILSYFRFLPCCYSGYRFYLCDCHHILADIGAGTLIFCLISGSYHVVTLVIGLSLWLSSYSGWYRSWDFDILSIFRFLPCCYSGYRFYHCDCHHILADIGAGTLKFSRNIHSPLCSTYHKIMW